MRSADPARRIVLALTLIPPLLTLSAVVTGRQARDPAAPVRAATSNPASLSGIVVADDQSSTPIRRAIVTVRGGDQPAQLGVITDDNGRFTLPSLSPGRYSVVANKVAYLDASYGATRPGRTGTPVILAAGQARDLRIVMSRGAAIEGAIRDDTGQPMADVTVTALDVRELQASVQLAGRDDRLRATTDDRGTFRIFGLAPGEYVIGATLSGAGEGDIGRRRDAEMDALLTRLGNRGQSSAPPEPHPPTVGFAPTYYPGVPVLTSAVRIRLAVGEERRGLDFAIVPVGVTTIEGTVSRSDGQAPSDVTLSVDLGNPLLSPVVSTANRPMTLAEPPDASGHFKFTNVVPGRYTIIARSGGATAGPAAGPGRGGAVGGGFATLNNGVSGPGAPVDPNAPTPLFATVDIEAVGQDVTGVALDLRPGVPMTGRVVFDASATTPPADLTTVRVMLGQPRGSYSMGTGDGTRFGNAALSVPPAMVRADSSFIIPAIGPGIYNVSGSVPNATTWWLRSAVLDGRDLLDSPLTVRSDAFAGVVFTFSDRHNELTGSLQTAEGNPAADYFVVAFPKDATLWITGSRRMKSARPGTDGVFTLRDLPAGDYLLAALTDFELRDFEDRSFLEQLAAPGQAIGVAIRDGAQTRQDIRIAR